MVDSVGAVYVRVLTDTSSMKREIENSAAEAGGKGSQAFGHAWQKAQQRHVDDLLFSRATQKRMKDIASKLGREIAEAERDGIKTVNFKVTDEMAKGFNEISKAFGKSAQDAKKAWDKDFIQILRQSINQAARDLEKLEKVKPVAAEITEAASALNRLTSRRGSFDIFGGLTRSLRRAGTGGAFDTITNLFGGMFGFSSLAGKAVTRSFELIGKAVTKFSGLFSKAGGIVGKFGETLASLGGVILKLAGPIGAAVAALAGFLVLRFIINSIQVLVPLVINLAGVFTLLAGAVGNTVLAIVPFVGIIGSLAVGLGVAAFAGKNAASALGALFKASLSGDPKDWEAYAEAIRKLGKNAGEAVGAFKPMLSNLKDLRREAEQKMFEGMAESIKKFVPVADAVKGAIGGIASAVGNVLDKFFELGNDPIFVSSLTTLMNAVGPIVTNIGQAMVSIFAGLVNFFASLSPMAVQVSAWIADIGEKFKSWTESDGVRVGIMQFFRGAWEVAKQVGDIVFTLGEIMLSVFGATQEPLSKNGGFLQAINDKLNAWLTWVQTEEGQGTIKNWLDEAASFAGSVAGAIKDIVLALGEWNTTENKQFLKDMVTQFGDVAKSVMGIVSAIDSVLNKISALKNALNKPLVPGLSTQGQKDEGGFWGLVQDLNRKLHMAEGGLVTSPTNALIGEAGPEIVIPLRRPLHLVNPEVREVARMLRSGGYTGRRPVDAAGPAKVVNVTQNITPAQSDPNAVAMSVLNRAAVLARG